MEIRHLKQGDDRFAISRIYEESWKFAYKDIIPQSYLESIPAGCWIPNLDKEGMNTLVLIEDGMFIGTSSYCKSRFSDFSNFGEIVSIYFLPQYIGKGYGKLLLEAVVRELEQLDFQDIFLWVLEDNLRARKFYEKAGFTPSEKYLDDNIGGKELREIQYYCSVKKVKYIKATDENTDCVFHIVQNTVTAIYPKYYPKEVVDFFCELHNRANIAKDIENGNVGILVVDNQIVGTGSHEGNHITRVYVLPEFQGKGYGSFIMQCLEEEIAAKYNTVLLDASLPASHLYEQRGYRTIKHEKWPVENDVVLVYEVMEKPLPGKTSISAVKGEERPFS